VEFVASCSYQARQWLSVRTTQFGISQASSSFRT